jgi:hypothetical protein
MNCKTFTAMLDDYVDGVRARNDGADPDRVAFESHLAGCQQCQALVADFNRIRLTASTLEEHVPPPRLWTGIAASVDAQPRRAFAWLPIAAAASLAIAIVGATWVAWTHLPSESQQPTVAAREQAPAAPVEAQYAEAIAGLERLASAQDAALDPQTRAVLRENLAAIDRAINESRAALADEPASTLAQDSLLDALDTKVALLTDAVALTSEDVNQ